MAYKWVLYTNYLLTGMILQVGYHDLKHLEYALQVSPLPQKKRKGRQAKMHRKLSKWTTTQETRTTHFWLTNSLNEPQPNKQNKQFWETMFSGV